MQKVYVKFPKAGLGNLMLIWARARYFSILNNIEMVVAPWWGLRPGAWIRNEKKKRLYAGYFKESSLLQRLGIKIFSLFADTAKNPPIIKLDNKQSAKQLFVFDAISSNNDIFSEIREQHDLIKNELYQLLSPAMLQQLQQYPVPVIAVHIRRGDFSIGNQTTSLSFFIDCIMQIRAATGAALPVTIFSDARPDEISEVLQLPQTSMAVDKPDILDILLMSKSRFIVLSKSSTFSYWAAFLSKAIVLRPFDDWQQQIRSNSINEQFAEISWKENDAACISKLNESLVKQLSHPNDIAG